MGRSLPGMTSAGLVKILRAHGCELVRQDGKHLIYQAPSGHKVSVSKGKTVTFPQARDAAKALGLTTKELLDL